MLKFTLEAPWYTFRKKVNALFEQDPDITVGEVIESEETADEEDLEDAGTLAGEYAAGNSAEYVSGESDTEAEAESEAEAENEIEAESGAEAETVTETEPEIEAETEGEVEAETEVEVEPEAEAAVETEPENESEPEEELKDEPEEEIVPESAIMAAAEAAIGEAEEPELELVQHTFKGPNGAKIAADSLLAAFLDKKACSSRTISDSLHTNAISGDSSSRLSRYCSIPRSKTSA